MLVQELYAAISGLIRKWIFFKILILKSEPLTHLRYSSKYCWMLLWSRILLEHWKKWTGPLKVQMSTLSSKLRAIWRIMWHPFRGKPLAGGARRTLVLKISDTTGMNCRRWRNQIIRFREDENRSSHFCWAQRNKFKSVFGGEKCSIFRSVCCPNHFGHCCVW